MSIFGNIRSAIFPSGTKPAPLAAVPLNDAKDSVAPRKEPAPAGEAGDRASTDAWARKLAAKGGRVPDDLQ
ncbi:MAG: hypothetical protein J0I13_06175 [Rhizobiales bacterium]|jgi:hypothetical protein|nr:hypothetical protein [Hyphomicrobiales bacterium]